VPLVSVLTPVYNGRSLLPRSAAELRAQLVADFEWIVVDDGSTDGSGDWLEGLGDPRIRVLRQANAGVTAALNRGLEAVTAPLVARHDAGDGCHPERLARQLERFAAEPELVLLGCRVRRLDPAGELLGLSEVVCEHEAIRSGLLRINLFQHSATMMRREALQRVGGYRPFFRCSQDLDLFLRLSETGRVGNLPQALSDWVLDPGSISFRQRRIQATYAEIARRCARERRAGRPDPVDTGRVPPPPGLRESEQEALRHFHLEAARSALMGGRRARSRHELAAARRLGLRLAQAWPLAAATALPAPLLAALRALRVAWITRAAR
jgi:glycosyltransferase involved in cell wall biosynthesis